MRLARVLRLCLAILLGALTFVSATAPSGAARLVDEPSAVAVAPLGVAAAEGPSPRFAFGSVVSQAAPSVNKVVTAIDSTPVANLKSVSLRPGQTVTFNISGQVQSAGAVDVADLFDASLIYFFDTGLCFPGTPADVAGTTTRPANLGGVLLCNPVLFGVNQSFSFDVIFQVSANAVPHSDPNFNVACVENTQVVDTFNLCTSAAGSIANTTPLSGVVFAASAGQVVNGGCTFTTTISAGAATTPAQCTLNNLTGPATISIPLAGGGAATIGCTPTSGVAATNCTRTFSGTPAIGSTATVTVGGVVVTSGPIGSGAVVFPTPIPPAVLTGPQALGQVQGRIPATFNAGAPPCGTPCTGNQNNLNVTGNQTSNFTWTVTATLPAAPAAGAGTRFFVTPTSAFPGGEAVPCQPAAAVAPAAGTVVTCSATTVGNPFLGAPAFLVFPGVAGAAGPVVGPATLTGPGAVSALPLLPPPPILPPPPLLPPPLLPPPPPLVPMPAPFSQEPMASVPIIPEADSLVLVLGGLAALALLGAWRARRRAGDDA